MSERRANQNTPTLASGVVYYAKNDNMKNIQILTDESCNFKFYEACGCNKVYEKVINNGEPNKCL